MRIPFWSPRKPFGASHWSEFHRPLSVSVSVFVFVSLRLASFRRRLVEAPGKFFSPSQDFRIGRPAFASLWMSMGDDEGPR